MVDSYDAIVIGGGPGGSAISTLLAQAGRKILQLEREEFPRYHIGESLLSGTADLLKKLGVLEKMEQAHFIKKFGVSWIWGVKRDLWTVYFKDALATPYDFGYQVERGPFDEMLLDNAREHGVNALERHQVVNLTWEGSRVNGVEYESAATGTKTTVEAPWVIDASGQSNFITRQVATKRWDEKLANMALWNYWENAYRPEGIDAGNTFLPTFSEGWWWFIPLRNDITSVGVVLDRENYMQAKKEGMKGYYLNAIQRTPELAERLKSAKMIDEMRVLKDWSYTYDRFFGQGFVAVGDAACFIDPLLSTGVHLAMLSGYLGAASLNTLLDEPQNEERILSFYQEQYSREFNRLKDQIYFLYGGHSSPESYFWHARKTMDMPGASPKQAFVSLIAGAYEHRSWYRRFIMNLDVPDQVRQLANGIFTGQASGSQMVSSDAPLERNPMWQERASFALDGLHLRPSTILSSADGNNLPLTPDMSTVLKHIDGRKNSAQLLDEIGENEERKNTLRSVLNEAITHGAVMVSKELAAQV